jgi:exodeoxyribonuclease VII large subunit
LGIRTRPVFANPFTIVDERAAIISQFLSSVQYQTRNFLEKEQLQITGLRGQVRALSPKLTLDRGYAVVRTTKGGLVTDPKKVSKGEQLRVTLSGGELGVTAD